MCAYLGGTPSIWELSAPSLSVGGAGRIEAGGGAGFMGGAPIPLGLQCVCRFFAVLFLWGKQPSGWCSQIMPGCISVTTFTILRPGKLTPCFFSSHTSAQGFLIRYCISSIAAHQTCQGVSLGRGIGTSLLWDLHNGFYNTAVYIMPISNGVVSHDTYNHQREITCLVSSS